MLSADKESLCTRVRRNTDLE